MCQIEAALLDGDLGKRFSPARALELGKFSQNFLLLLPVFVIGKLEEDEAEYWRGVFAGFEI
jgi:hypothetical protein